MSKTRFEVLGRVVCVVLMLLLMPLTVLGANPVSKGEIKAITLRTNSFMPEPHVVSQAMRWWAEQVTAKTEGRLQFKHFYSGALGDAQDQLDNLRSGVFDIGPFMPFWSPAKSPLWTVYAGPKVSSKDAAVRFKVFFDLAEMKVMKDELARWGSMFLFPFVGAELNHVWTTKKAIHNLDDLKGLKIKDTGLKSKAIALLGANPVAMITSEGYDALSKGVIDGSVDADASVLAYKFYEICKNKSTLITGMGAPMWLIKLSVFNGLPADIQKALIDVSKNELAPYLVNEESKFMDKANAVYRENGVMITKIPEAEQERFEKIAVIPVMEGWIKDMEKKGLPGREVYEFYRTSASKYEKK